MSESNDQLSQQTIIDAYIAIADAAMRRALQDAIAGDTGAMIWEMGSIASSGKLMQTVVGWRSPLISANDLLMDTLLNWQDWAFSSGAAQTMTHTDHQGVQHVA